MVPDLDDQAMRESVDMTGENTRSLLDERIVKSATILGRLLGVKDFWFRLIREKIGTTRIEAEAAKRVSEQCQSFESRTNEK